MRYAIAALLVAGALTLAGCGGSSSSGTTTAPATTAPATTATVTTTAAPKSVVISIQVQGGKPVGGIHRVTAKKGQTVAVVVHSDVAEEVHVHGYDLMKDVEKGGTVKFDFKANIDGRFEIELEDAKEQLADLSVEP